MVKIYPLCILIPFRFGNQEIKNKNSEIILNKRLFERSINHALELKKLTPLRICLSTNRPGVLSTNKDLREIFDGLILRRTYFNSTLNLTSLEIDLHKRTEKLASKTTPILNVLNSVRRLYLKKNMAFNNWLLLQPTSPFRSFEDFKIILRYLNSISKSEEVGALVSVTPVEGLHPARMYTEQDGKLKYLLKKSNIKNDLRQNLERVFIRDGAFYLFSDKLLESGDLGLNSPNFFIRNFPWNINIDTLQDLQIARLILHHQVINDPNTSSESY